MDNQRCRYKVKLVEQAFTQKFGVDYDEVFLYQLRAHKFMFLIIASSRKMTVRQFDFKIAVLNGILKGYTYLRQPPEQENKILRLNKSHYGLKQAEKVVQWKKYF